MESTLRRTPVPLYQKQLEVATQMLADPLDYQLSAVNSALSDERLWRQEEDAGTHGCPKQREHPTPGGTFGLGGCTAYRCRPGWNGPVSRAHQGEREETFSSETMLFTTQSGTVHFLGGSWGRALGEQPFGSTYVLSEDSDKLVSVEPLLDFLTVSEESSLSR